MGGVPEPLIFRWKPRPMDTQDTQNLRPVPASAKALAALRTVALLAGLGLAGSAAAADLDIPCAVPFQGSITCAHHMEAYPAFVSIIDHKPWCTWHPKSRYLVCSYERKALCEIYRDMQKPSLLTDPAQYCLRSPDWPTATE